MLLRNTFTRDARVVREARSLARAGHEVTVLALRAGELPKREERDGFVVLRAAEAGRFAGPTISGTVNAHSRLRLPRTPLFVWTRDKLLDARMTRAAIALPADAYHAHDLNTLEPAAMAAREHGARLVYDAHELYADMTGLGRGERARWRRLESRLIRRADLVIAPSPSRAEEMVARYGIEEPRVVMNCPPMLQSLDPSASPLAGLRREGETLLVYAGGFTPNRGLQSVVRAVELLDGCRLVMLGWGPLESELRALASDRVTFAGHVDPDEVVPTVAGADIGLAPYLPIGRNNQLAAPNKVFEYLHAGLAVAASDLPDIRRIVDDHDVGTVFDASDPASVVDAVSGLIPRLDLLKRNARATGALYSWEMQETQLLGAYEALETR